MLAIAFLFACVACTGHGRRVQSTVDRLQSGTHPEQTNWQDAVVRPFSSLTKLIMKSQPAAAWHINGAGLGNGVFASKHIGNRVNVGPSKSQLTHMKAMPSKSRHGSASMQESESFEFQAEVAKVMDIIINSLYSDKDIFLRELVSNAADACDKKKILSLTGGGPFFESRVRLTPDKKANTLTIEDNGIGMTRDELKQNLGRIAESGTKKFSQTLKADDAANLIGQFGVGFYSAFLVADKVTVITKSKDGPQLRWESESANKYTISPDDSEPIEGSGTRLVLTMKEDADKYLDDYTLRTMLKKYSDFLEFAIELWTEKTDYDTVPDPDAEVKEGEEPPTKTVPRTSNVWEKVNVAKPIWVRSPKDVKQEEYTEFYKQTFRQYDEPMDLVHFSLEGQFNFKAILFTPSEVPWELSQDMFSDKVSAMRLYVKRVFISDKFKDALLPRWLTFIKGLVDSDDLPLNVSREILQKSNALTLIRKRLIRKALDMFEKIMKDETKSDKFAESFGRYLKVGIIEDQDNKDALLKLSKFSSTDSNKGTTLTEYVTRMKEDQKQIYYLSGTSKEVASSSPVLERAKKKGYEVLLALDQIDELALQSAGKFDGHDVVDAAKETTELGELSEDEKREVEKDSEDFEKTVVFIKSVLGERVDKVTISSRLTESPSALVQPQYGISPSMQRFMKAQSAASGKEVQTMQKGTAANLEINPKHEVVKKLRAMVATDTDKTTNMIALDYAELLFDVASISSGYDLESPAQFAKRVVALMSGGEEALKAAAAAAAAAKETDPEPATAPEAASAAAASPDDDTPIVPEVL